MTNPPRRCQITDCPNPHVAKDYCALHYSRAHRGVDPSGPVRPYATKHAPTCDEAGCDKPYYAKDKCSAHYTAMRRDAAQASPPSTTTIQPSGA